MATEFLTAAQDALNKLGINIAAPRSATDTITASSDLSGKSHQAYTQRLADEEAARKRAADLAAQTAAAAAQTAAANESILKISASPTATAAATPTATAAATPVKSTWAGLPSNALIQRDPVTGAYRAKGWDEDAKGFIEVTPESLKQNAALRRTMEWGMGPTAYGSNPAYSQYSNEVKNLFGLANMSTTGNFTGYKRPWQY